MKRIFFVYWIWHLIILVIQFIDPFMSVLIAKAFACFNYSSLFYISLFAFIHLSTATQGTQSDLKYMYACMATIVTRWSIMIVGIAFSKDVYLVLTLDALTILAYFGVKWRLTYISESKLYNAINQRK